jgi:hypothetical protein
MRTPIEVIFEAGCIATGADPREIRRPRRTKWHVCRRRFIARKMRAEGYSPRQIGKALGGFDRTTILNLLNSDGWR